jgi:hypothetical protein
MSGALTDAATIGITEKVLATFGPDSSVTVRRDPYRGYRILVVIPDGAGDPPAERRR